MTQKPLPSETSEHVVVIEAQPAPIHIDMTRTAVLVIDMQNDFGAKGGMFDRAGIDISMIQRAVAPTARVLTAARQAGIPVVYLKMAFRPDLSDAGPTDAPNWIKLLHLAVGRMSRLQMARQAAFSSGIPGTPRFCPNWRPRRETSSSTSIALVASMPPTWMPYSNDSGRNTCSSRAVPQVSAWNRPSATQCFGTIRVSSLPTVRGSHWARSFNAVITMHPSWLSKRHWGGCRVQKSSSGLSLHHRLLRRHTYKRLRLALSVQTWSV